MTIEFVHLLKEKHLSLTSVRLAVLETLHEHPHSDAQTLFEHVRKRIPAATIQAVYNNLNTLTDAGILQEIKPKGQVSLYETRVGDNHHHVVCRGCGHIEDTDCHGCAPCLVPADDHGFSVDRAEVIFWGLCPSCQDNTNKRQPKKER